MPPGTLQHAQPTTPAQEGGGGRGMVERLEAAKSREHVRALNSYLAAAALPVKEVRLNTRQPATPYARLYPHPQRNPPCTSPFSLAPHTRRREHVLTLKNCLVAAAPPFKEVKCPPHLTAHYPLSHLHAHLHPYRYSHRQLSCPLTPARHTFPFAALHANPSSTPLHILDTSSYPPAVFTPSHLQVMVDQRDVFMVEQIRKQRPPVFAGATSNV